MWVLVLCFPPVVGIPLLALVDILCEYAQSCYNKRFLTGVVAADSTHSVDSSTTEAADTEAGRYNKYDSESPETVESYQG